MNKPENVLVVNDVSKRFALNKEKPNSVKSFFTSSFKSREQKTTVFEALNNIDFSVKKGEFFGIVGRNGSGKSTLLKLMAGIYQPTSGSITAKGKLVPFIELGVGFNPELTGRENVYLNGAMLGFSKLEIDKQYKEIVAFAELNKFMDQKLKNYSSGMQVRLAFSMATRAKADILLVDEVLAVGDADFQRKCFDYFRELKKSHTTVVFVTHDMNAVREYCDRAVLIEKSRIVAEGTPDKIATKYTRLFEKDFETGAADDIVDRWGDRSAEVMNVTTCPGKITKTTKEIVLNMDVKINDSIEDVTVGFRIRNATGAALMGTNNLLKKAPIEPVVKGQILKVEWIIPNIFGDGKYLVDTAVVYNFTTKTADWWDEAATFKVFNDEKTSYFTNPHVAVKIDVAK